MRAVDTNILVRVLTRDDEQQLAIAEKFIAGGAWVSHLVLAETAWVLGTKYGLDDAAIATAIEMLLNHAQFRLQEPDVILAAVLHYRKRPALKFSDCLILEIARNAGHLPLGTFDRALATLDGAELISTGTA